MIAEVAALSGIDKALKPWLPGTPNVTGLHISCPQVNALQTSVCLAGTCFSSTMITSRPFTCLLCSLRSWLAVLLTSRSLQCHTAGRAPQHCSKLHIGKKTTQGACGLNTGKISAVHIVSAKPPLIFSAESESGQPMNEVLLLIYCRWCLGFPQLESLWNRVSQTETCLASAAAQHSLR